MKTYLASLLFLCMSWHCYVQETVQDSIAIIKNDTIVVERTFQEDLKKVYSDKDFQYTEEEVEKNEKSEFNSGFLNFFIFFMSKIFPFLLGGIVVFLLLKVLFGLDVNFWNKKNRNKKITEKLIFEDEDVHELNIADLLAESLKNKNYRLAIRYYYLQVLRDLSNKKLIDYHKDKTNSEYIFEIDNEKLRSQFSKLSYIYSYVWYGEFTVDTVSFQKAEMQYQAFLNQIT